MMFTQNDVDKVQTQMQKRLSQKRFLHTDGVLKTAQRLSALCLPDKYYELSVAALLHDVAKEYSIEEQLRIIKKHGIPTTDEDIMSPAVLHSYAGAALIREDFTEYATDDVTSAVFNHTVGSPDMSVFDEVIFLSDFIEPTRSYDSCVALRERVFSLMKNGMLEDNVRLLHSFCVDAINSTYESLVSKKSHINSKMLLTAKALKDKK